MSVDSDLGEIVTKLWLEGVKQVCEGTLMVQIGGDAMVGVKKAAMAVWGAAIEGSVLDVRLLAENFKARPPPFAQVEFSRILQGRRLLADWRPPDTRKYAIVFVVNCLRNSL